MKCFSQLRRVLVALSAVACVAAPARAFKRTSQGEAVKDFSVEGLAAAGPLRLSEQLGTGATVVIFWATWSPRSADALADFQQLYSEHGGKGLQVLAVNVDHQKLDGGQLQAIADFVGENRLTFPVGIDEGLRVFDRYGVIAVPSSFLADSQGTIVALLEGYSNMTRRDFKERVLETLGVKRHEDTAVADAAGGYRPSGKAARFYQMGELFLKKKMTERAEKAFRQAIQEDQGYADAYQRLAEVLEQKGEAAAASEARGRAADLAGNPPAPAPDSQASFGNASPTETAPHAQVAEPPGSDSSEHRSGR